MTKVSIDDHLDALIEDLMNEKTTPKEREKLIEISRAVIPIVKTKVQMRHIEIEQERLKCDQLRLLNDIGGINSEDIIGVVRSTLEQQKKIQG